MTWQSSIRKVGGKHELVQCERTVNYLPNISMTSEVRMLTRSSTVRM